MKFAVRETGPRDEEVVGIETGIGAPPDDALRVAKTFTTNVIAERTAAIIVPTLATN